MTTRGGILICPPPDGSVLAIATEPCLWRRITDVAASPVPGSKQRPND
jgi:hypothetical protein